MNTTRKHWLVGAAALILVLFVAGAVLGFGPPGFGPARFPRLVLAHIDDKVEELSLSEAQQKQYLELRDRLKDRLEQSAARRREMFGRLHEEINREEPDVKALTGLARERIRELPGLMEANLDLFLEFYELLSPEQKEKLIQKARKKINRFQEFCLEG